MNFILRPWSINDLDNLVLYANNAEIAKYMNDGFAHPYTKENGEAFIAFANEDNPVHVFAIDLNGEAIGGIGLHPKFDVDRKNAELGYWLAEPFWGKGIITAAIKEIVHFGFITFDIKRIFARPFGTNKGSQKALEKAGFVLEATFEKTLYKHGESLDELIYAIRKEVTINAELDL